MDEQKREGAEVEAQAEEEAVDLAAVSAPTVHAAIRLEGEEELGRPVAGLAWSALAAGLSMGFSLVAQGILRAYLPDAPWSPLVAKLGYCIGFLVVVLGRQQLFTETTLTVILPLLHRPSPGRLASVARVWVVVLAGNVLGAAIFAWAITRSSLMDPRVQRAFVEIGREAIAPGFAPILMRAVFGGWLIALMVWLMPAAENAKFFVIITITWLVGVGSFSHIIAGSVDVLALVAHGELSLPGYVARWLVPTFVGNSIGGVSLVAALNHAQVAATLRRAP